MDEEIDYQKHITIRRKSSLVGRVDFSRKQIP